MKKFIRLLFSGLLVALLVVTFVGCGPKVDDVVDHTYNQYLTLSPSNWNELTYQDTNDTEIMSWLKSDFFEFDYKFDAKGDIVPGQFEIKYNAATNLEDITAKYAGKYNVPAAATKDYAFKITLRKDLKWHDGTKIYAEDFVYTMKEQLNPLFQHYRADSYYIGSTIIHNAENYVKQGQELWVDGDNGNYKLEDFVKGDDGVYTQPDGKPIKFCMNEGLQYLEGDTVADYAGYLDKASYDALVALQEADGRVNVTDETIALWTTLINTDSWGNEEQSQLPSYIKYFYSYDAMDFSEVGIFAEGKYDLIIVLDKALDLIDENGDMTYKCAYNMASLPLVKQDLYEACKVAPTEGNDLWTSTYNSSLDTTASWGPYMLTKFQAGKEFDLTRNLEYFLYGTKEGEGLYETDVIHTTILKDWNTAWLEFQSGNLDGIGIDVSIADDYKNSERAYYTPDDFVAALQLQSNVDALIGRQEEGKNKAILGNVKFRKALSLGFDREDFASKTTTSSKKGFGLFNSMHYYDVAHGGVYRNEDVARQVLCDVYSVDTSKYASLKDAEAALTGYDLETARRLVTEAYQEELAAGNIKENDIVSLVFGTGAITEAVTRRFEYLKNAWTEMLKTTPLEGRLEVELKDFQTKWANDFRNGAYDICMGGWSGAAWDPGYFLLAYLSPSYMYSKAWKTNEAQLTFTMVGGAEDGSNVTDTLSLLEWYDCLNGAANAKYNFGAGAIEEAKRLTLIAALEKEVLSVFYTVPLYNNFGASLISYKCEYKSYTYNTFMGYGGIKYMTYLYTDAEWNDLITSTTGGLDYKG